MIPAIVLSIVFAVIIAALSHIGMANQDLSEVANRALRSSPTGGFVRFDAYAGSGLKQGYIVKMDSVTRTADLAQSDADPNDADDPFGAVDEHMTVGIDVALTAAMALRIIPLKSKAVVWLLFSGGEAGSANGVTRGEEVVLSINDAGMVRVAPDFATLVENTPTTGGLADAVQQLKNNQKTRIGTAMETNALHGSDDIWAPVRLD